MAIPNDPNDGSLLSSIFIRGGEKAHDQASAILDLFHFPNPQEREYFSGPNVDRLYLNDQGLVLSFVYRNPTFRGMLSKIFGRSEMAAAPVFDVRKVVDERILQPLYQVDLSPECCMEIVPGVYSMAVKPTHIQSIAQELKKKQIHFFNQKEEFVAELRTPPKEEDLMVVSNRRAIKVAPGKQAMGSGEAVMQDLIYGDLSVEMQDAFDRASFTAVQRIMKECRKIVSLPRDDHARILNCHWKDDSLTSERRSNIRQVAFEWQRRLNQ